MLLHSIEIEYFKEKQSARKYNCICLLFQLNQCHAAQIRKLLQVLTWIFAILPIISGILFLFFF